MICALNSSFKRLVLALRSLQFHRVDNLNFSEGSARKPSRLVFLDRGFVPERLRASLVRVNHDLVPPSSISESSAVECCRGVHGRIVIWEFSQSQRNTSYAYSAVDEAGVIQLSSMKMRNQTKVSVLLVTKGAFCFFGFQKRSSIEEPTRASYDLVTCLNGNFFIYLLNKGRALHGFFIHLAIRLPPKNYFPTRLALVTSSSRNPPVKGRHFNGCCTPRLGAS